MRAFVYVVDSGSFTKAAHKLSLTQSAISQKIKRLETHFNKLLLSRDGKYSPTHYGDVVYDYSKTILSKYEEMASHLDTTEVAGEIRFGLPEDFATFFLLDVLLDYRSIHPSVFLDVECNLTLNLYDKFKQGGFDLILVKMDSLQDIPEGVEILNETLVWVGNASLLSSDSEIPLVLAPKPCVYRLRATSTLSERQIPWKVTFVSSSFASIIAAVTAGVGLTVLPEIMVPKSCSIITDKRLPKLPNTHISLIKKEGDNPLLNSFESFVIHKLRDVIGGGRKGVIPPG